MFNSKCGSFHLPVVNQALRWLLPLQCVEPGLRGCAIDSRGRFTLIPRYEVQPSGNATRRAEHVLSEPQGKMVNPKLMCDTSSCLRWAPMSWQVANHVIDTAGGAYRMIDQSQPREGLLAPGRNPLILSSTTQRTIYVETASPKRYISICPVELHDRLVDLSTPHNVRLLIAATFKGRDGRSLPYAILSHT